MISTRRLRYVARPVFQEQISPWVSVLLLILLCVNAAQRAVTWRGDVLLAIDAQGTPLFIVGPLLLAAIAVDTARAGTPGRQQHVALTRPTMRPYLFVLLSGVVPTVGVLGLFGIGSVMYAGWSYFSIDSVLPALLQLLVLSCMQLFFGSTGSLVGRMGTPLAAGILGVVVGMLLVYSHAASAGKTFSLMALGGATVPRVGLTYSVAYLACQILAFGTLALLAYFVSPRFSSGGVRPSPAMAAAGLSVAVAVVATPPGLPAARWVEAAPPGLSCPGEFPDLCLTPQHEHLRPTVEPLVRKVANATESVGLQGILPSRIVEMTRSDDPSVDGVTTWGFGFEEGQLRGVPADLQLFVINLLVPKRCETLTPEKEQALARLASSLLIPAGIDPIDLIIGEPEDHQALTPRAALAARDQLATCP